MKRIFLFVLVTALTVGTGRPTGADAALTAHVRPSVAMGPSDVVIQAFIEPNELNRAVRYEIDSESFYSSSTAELNGDQAPRERQFVFRTVPAGAYQVRITLIGAKGTRGHVDADVQLW